MPSKTLSDFKDRFLKPSPTRSEERHAAKHTLPASFALFQISIFIPFERAFWQGIIARRRELYPHVNFDHLCFADVLRICIQTIFLALFTTLPVRDFWQFNPLARFVRAVIRTVGRIGEAIGRLGGRIIFNIGANIVKSRRRVGREHVSKFQNSIFWAAGIVAGLLAVLCITQPFNVQGQVVFLSIVLLSAWSLTHIKARISLMLLFVLSVTVSGRYLWWRYTSTIHADGAVSLFLSCLLLAAETYAFIVMVLGYFQVCWPLDRRPKRLPADRTTWPTVDIFIPTYNESLEVIKPTVFAAKNLDWPEDKINVYILDDGSRDWVEAFAKAAGVHYIKRDEHNHAKAGNINNAMKHTSGEFITIYDCDHVPSSDFLTSTVGWLVHDKKIALVQTPHHFYSPDPFEKNLHLDRAMPFENSLFHDYIQKGNDTWNAVMFCGSNAVMRRSALEEIGGIAVETVTEDAHTSLKLNRRGWKSACISKPLASGLSTESLSAHIGQRIRWARGMIQIFRLDNPMLKKGLTLPQRLCFMNAMIHFLHGLPRIIFLLAPLPYMFFDIYVIYATAAAIFAYVIPHMVHAAITNQQLQRGYRYPFLGGVYETVLSWYILLPTTVALIFPHKGKFNVTAKGMTIDKKYVDWRIATPVLILMVLNLLGLAIGIYKTVTAADPQVSTLIINIAWIAYNLLVLGAAFAVAVEEIMEHPLPRVPLKAGAVVITDDGSRHAVPVVEFSQTELVLDLKGLAVGESVAIEMTGNGHTDTFKATVAREAKGFTEFDLIFESVEDEIRFNRQTFAREGHWGDKFDHHVDDRFVAGFLRLVGFAAYGFKSLIEFLPGTAGRIVRYVVSFMPRMPKTSVGL